MAIIGTIIGDIIGSQYEFKKPDGFDYKTAPLFSEKCRFTDDTVLALATKNAILNKIGLMKILVENSSKENETVIDPFMGIGSTALACIETNRKFIGIEIDNKYYNIAEDRIKNAI